MKTTIKEIKVKLPPTSTPAHTVEMSSVLMAIRNVSIAVMTAI